MFKELDVVILKRPIKGIPVPKGTEGTVLIVHPNNPPAYEVEFMDGAESLGFFTVYESDLELLEPWEFRGHTPN